MKKKVRNKGFVYFFAFMFLALIAFAGLGAYSGGITGFTISESMANSFGLIFGIFGGILNSAITFIGVSEEYIGLKLIIGILLFIILKFVLSKGGKDGLLGKNANVFAIIFSLAFIALTPKDLMESIFGSGSQIGPYVVFVAILVVGYFLYYIFKTLHNWKDEGGFIEFTKFIIYFFIFMIISL